MMVRIAGFGIAVPGQPEQGTTRGGSGFEFVT
jgi:hypothetical protein